GLAVCWCQNVGDSPWVCYSSLCSFSNGRAPTALYTLSLHDALPIFSSRSVACAAGPSSSLRSISSWLSPPPVVSTWYAVKASWRDRKSTRLNSSHVSISYAVFCLKKKKQHRLPPTCTRPSCSSTSCH